MDWIRQAIADDKPYDQFTRDILAATGEFLGAHIDMQSRRTSPFAPQIAERIDRLIVQRHKSHQGPPQDGPVGRCAARD